MGSIKDRIKSFEYMKDSGTTSPQANLPVPNESSRTPRKTGATWDRDSSERRQIRRSERRDAELRRENEILALTAKEMRVRGRQQIPATDISQRAMVKKSPLKASERKIPRVPPCVTPRVSTGGKDKSPEAPVRRRNEIKESWNTEKNTHRLARLQKFVSPEKTGPVPTTESSSNETLYTHSSEETTTDVSSEEVEQKESEDEFIEAGANGSEEDGHEEYEHQEDDANEEEIVDDGERSEGSNGTFVDEEYAEEVEPEKGVEENVDESEENCEENDVNNDADEKVREKEAQDELENSEDDAVFEQAIEKEPLPITEELKHERNKIASYRRTPKTSEQQQHGNSGVGEDSIGVSRVARRRKGHINREGETSERLLYENNVKLQQKQGSVTSNETGIVKPVRHRIDQGHMTQTENTTNVPKLVQKKQRRKRGSASGNDSDIVEEAHSSKIADISPEKSESNSVKPKKGEQNHRKLGRTRSISNGARRSGSRCSLKSLPAEDIAEAANKSEQSARDAEVGSNASSCRKSRKTSSDADESSEHLGNESEVISRSSLRQPTLYSNGAVGLLPVGVQATVDVDSESTSSLDLRYDGASSKRAFVCAIHEEPCKYYCQDCERLICSECAMRWGDCHEHYYLRVKDAWKKYREEMMKILHEARSNVSRIQQEISENSKERDSFKLKVESTIKKINNFFDEHVLALQKRRTNFLETVEEIIKFREIEINQEIDSLQNNLVETNSTIDIAGRVYGTSTMMEFLQVCKQLTNRLLELGNKKITVNVTESVDIDFISEPNLFKEIEKVGRLKNHKDSSPSKLPLGRLIEEISTIDCKISNADNPSQFEVNEQDSIESVTETSTDLSESMSAKDTNNSQPINLLKDAISATRANDPTIVNDEACDMINATDEPMKIHDEIKTQEHFQQLHHSLTSEYPVSRQGIPGVQLSRPTVSVEKEMFDCKIDECSCDTGDSVDDRNGFHSQAQKQPEILLNQTPATVKQHVRRHSMDDLLDIRRKKEIQCRLGGMARYRPPNSAAPSLDDGECYFSSGEAEQRRRKQECHKVRFNERAYYSNPSDSSELEEMRGYNFDKRLVKNKVRRHRTTPLIKPISERRELKSPWTLDVFRYHGKIHFSRNSLKATGKAFGWNAVVGSQGFSQGRHTWKVRVTKWTAVGVCYKDDHVDNPSWGAGNKWTWDSADMCYSPRLGVCESPVREWIDGDIIALELDCDNSLLIVRNLRTSETDKLYGFKHPVYPYFYLSVFRSVSLIDIDGMQVGS